MPKKKLVEMTQLPLTAPGWSIRPVWIRTDAERFNDGEVIVRVVQALSHLAVIPTWWVDETSEAGNPLIQFDRNKTPGPWVVLHIPTAIVFTFFSTEARAMEFCELANRELGDLWDFRPGYYPSGKKETENQVLEFIKQHKEPWDQILRSG